MSLFTGTDALNLPLATQVAQLLLPEDLTDTLALENSEVKVFALRQTGSPHPEWPIHWETTEQIMERYPNGSVMSLTTPLRIEEEHCLVFPATERDSFHTKLLLFAEVCVLTRTLLTALASNELLPREAVQRLAQLIDDHVRMSIYFVDPRHVGPPLPISHARNDLAPEQLQLVDLATDAPPFIATILLELRHVSARTGSAAVCIDCGSPFVMVRSGQVFCSHRCADRYGQRRRWSEKKGGKLVTRRRRVLS